MARLDLSALVRTAFNAAAENTPAAAITSSRSHLGFRAVPNPNPSERVGDLVIARLPTDPNWSLDLTVDHSSSRYTFSDNNSSHQKAFRWAFALYRVQQTPGCCVPSDHLSHYYFPHKATMPLTEKTRALSRALEVVEKTVEAASFLFLVAHRLKTEYVDTKQGRSSSWGSIVGFLFGYSLDSKLEAVARIVEGVILQNIGGGEDLYPYISVRTLGLFASGAAAQGQLGGIVQGLCEKITSST